MARLPRFFLYDSPLHVIQRGNNRSKIFNQIGDYNFYLDCLKEASQRHGCDIHGYVLMPNHVHLLLTPSHSDSLPKTLQSLGRRYVQYFNSTHERTGTLWEGRYRATLIDSEAYLLTCCRYIELNPVRAELVRHPRDYRWSSYRYHAIGKPDSIVNPHPLYQQLGLTDAARQQTYRGLFRQHLSGETLDTIREATNKAWVLGTQKFKDRIAKKLERRVEPLPRGRPSTEHV